MFADRTVGLTGLYARYRQLIHESARFAVVGLAGLVVTVGGANLLRYQAGMGRLSAVAIATVVATAASSWATVTGTFRQRQRTTVHSEGFRYLVLTGAGLMIQLACVRLAVGVLGPHDNLSREIALMLGVGLGILFRYWSCRTWVWRALPPAPSVVA